jgi:hypothetical protein
VDLAFPKTGKVVLRGIDYWRFKQQLHQLDGWQCKICNRIAGLTVSHMIKRSKLRLDTEENCYSACFPCHDLIERNIIKAEWEDLATRKLRITKLEGGRGGNKGEAKKETI